MDLREPNSGDTDRLRELVESAMTASYALSPQQIESIVEEEFGDERSWDGSDMVALVAEGGEETETVIGVVEAELDGETGEVRWLFVDPEYRGGGVGTRLFEAAVETLRDRGAERVQASTFEANSEGARFFERFDYERTDERQVELGDESLIEYVYTEPSAAGERADSAKTDEGELEFPDTEVRDGALTATTADGERVYIDRDDEESGTEDAFFVTYTDEAHTERFGYYCSNCGSLDVSVDDMDRMRCGECGNAHATRSSEEYDDSYL